MAIKMTNKIKYPNLIMAEDTVEEILIKFNLYLDFVYMFEDMLDRGHIPKHNPNILPALHRFHSARAHWYQVLERYQQKEAQE